jgi:hypothetical protein
VPPSAPRPPADPAAAQDASGRLRSAGDELAEACSALETEVEELKAKYEMYFLGVELREPKKWREEVRKKVLRLKETFTRNTGLRFRLQTLHARFISYERLWLRSVREREEGTYRRDIEKAKRHARAKAGPQAGPARPAGRPGASQPHESEDVDLSDFGDETAPAAALAPAGATPAQPPVRSAPPAGLPPPGATAPPWPVPPPGTARPSAPLTTPAPTPGMATPLRPVAPAPPPRPAAMPAPTARPAAASPAAPSSGARLGEAQMRELYDAYVAAKKRCNEDTSRITYDAVARSVSKQIPEIMQQHKAKSVEFKVVIKDGKARLTAVPKI